MGFNGPLPQDILKLAVMEQLSGGGCPANLIKETLL